MTDMIRASFTRDELPGLSTVGVVCACGERYDMEPSFKQANTLDCACGRHFVLRASATIRLTEDRPIGEAPSSVNLAY